MTRDDSTTRLLLRTRSSKVLSTRRTQLLLGEVLRISPLSAAMAPTAQLLPNGLVLL